MMKNGQDHPAPELLLDLAEGSPVPSFRADHLSGCAECTSQVAELRETLELLRRQSGAEPTAEPDGEGFASRLSQRIEREIRRRRIRRRVGWTAVAAVLVAAWVGWLARDELGPIPGEAPQKAEGVLPPLEQDSDYQVLLSLAELLELEGDLQILFEVDPYPSMLDLGQLTAEERRELRRELERDLEAAAHAKS